MRDGCYIPQHNQHLSARFLPQGNVGGSDPQRERDRKRKRKTESLYAVWLLRFTPKKRVSSKTFRENRVHDIGLTVSAKKG